VSVVTPTRGKTQKWLPQLYRCFLGQTYVFKELIVVDSSKRPSKAFQALIAEDARVYYLHTTKNMSLGSKRNMLTGLANGTILAHFDDDDWYAPTYLETMVDALEDNEAQLVKLSGWFVFSCKLRFFGYFDPAETTIFGEVSDAAHGGLKYSLFLDPREKQVQTWVMGPSSDYDKKLQDETRFGFGFSYVYRKTLATRFEFSGDKTFGEDLHFVTRVLQAGVRVHHFADDRGLCLHIQGHWNTARIPTQYKIPAFLVRQIFGQGALNYTRC